MPLILPGNVASATASTGFNVANSCRFGESFYMHKTPGGAGNRRIFTLSAWVKRGTFINAFPFGGGSGLSDYTQIGIQSDDFVFYDEATGVSLRTNAKYRDVSAWYNLIAAVDTTQGTEANRIKMYVNGTQVTSFSTETYPSQNDDLYFGQTEIISVGALNYTAGIGDYFDGYLAEVCYIDGQQLTPTSFGEFDEDSPTIWKPIDVSGLTFGTNGFYLDFEASDNLGNDANGGTDLTEVNLGSQQQCQDSPTNNFAIINPLDTFYTEGTLSEGNNKMVTAQTPEPVYTNSTIGVASGKWYCEVKNLTPSGRAWTIGISGRFCSSSDDSLGSDLDGFGYTDTGVLRNNDSTASYGDSYTENDIIGIALDLDNNKLYFSKNGTWQDSGDPESGATGTGAISIGTPSTGFYFISLGDNSGDTTTFQTNFGNPTFSISSGNADGNGYGNFEYAVPSGYLALCTKNLGSDGG